MDSEDAASELQGFLRFSVSERSEFRSWSAALSGLAGRAESAGALVMISGIVGSNTHRKLEPEEFRGFALVDDLAPVVFVNGVDTKAAQIFTLVHELGHLCLGESAVSRPDLEAAVEDSSIEQWCNTFAAEFLVPRASLANEFDRNVQLIEELERLAGLYKSSTLVVLRRLLDIDLMSRDQYFDVFRQERARILALMGEASQSSSSGGDFYNVQPVRVSKRFARSIISDTLEGNTPYRDAARLLGFRKQSTFEVLGERLGVVA
jgi:Zn-dependent peptidase ImmA (M78 family)